MIGRIKLYEMGCFASLLMQFFDNNANIIDGNIKTSYRMHQSSDCKYKMISKKADHTVMISILIILRKEKMQMKNI